MTSHARAAFRAAVVEAHFENARQEVARFARGKSLTDGFLMLYSPAGFPTVIVGDTPAESIKVWAASVIGYYAADGNEIEGALNGESPAYMFALSSREIDDASVTMASAFDELNGELPEHLGRLHGYGYAAVADVAKLLQATA